ncbi:MAG TPA: hypothetical protein VLT86_04135 [Vicinamibacterales bacterium]|nr:hypothetical protein [Vicinamibacterales bacterium]
MASTKSRRSSGSRRRPSTSKAKRRARGGQRRAVPPPDNALLRHEEGTIDHRIEGEREVVRSASLQMAMAVAAGRKPKAPAKPAGDSTKKRQAAMRLSALAQSRALRGDDAARPARARTRTLSDAAPGGVDLIAPVSGISNWVQLGPTAIPGGQTYSSARVFVTGRVTAIVVDPTDTNIIYIGTAQGGVWKTTDGGLSWAPKTDNEISLAIGSLVMDPGNHLVLYAGTGEGNFSGDSYYGNGILKSSDGGSSWTTLAQATFTGTRFSRLAVTPGTPSRLFAATGTGVYRSTDSGATWTKMTGGALPTLNATDVCIDPSTPTTVYAAFWGGGVFQTTNASAATPTWTKLAGGLPTSGFTRIALGISPSSPSTVYALMAGLSNANPSLAYLVNRFLRSDDSGATWTNIALPGSGNIGGQGFYNLNVAVDPTTPDIVYLSGISLWKAVRSGGAWTITNVGGAFHPDNHAFAFQPGNHLVVYAGSDGGVYRSPDGGATWSDTINEGPCITQFEFIDLHPTSDAVVFGGTQDNGTEQFRNSPVFNHADDGDGGFVAVDRVQPNNVLSTYYGPSPKRSTQGGAFGTWFDVSPGLSGSSLFYPPLALDQTNPNNIAFGTSQVGIDAAQGTGGWPTQVALPGISGLVSAIDYVNSSLMYAGTTDGEVYRLAKSGATWTATAIQAAPLPGQWIWDVQARPDDANTIIVVMSGFGIQHVWRGVVAPGGGSATWTSVSGSGGGALPDIPVNALVIDPAAPNTYYIATDVAVFRTTNAGTSWTPFSEGLPNCAVFDLRLHAPTRLLRAGTHGRGLWERRLDTPSMPDVDLYFRDHVMATGRTLPTPSVTAAFADPLQYVALNDPLWWWQCADIKVDALEGTPPNYQMPVAAVDYAAYESKLQHRNAQRGRVNRVYVQLHNRGITPGANVTVKLLYADASAGLPALPSDFWTAFPNDSTNTTQWKPIGSAKVVSLLSDVEPAVVEWDWSTPTSAADHSCLLVVMDSPSNPIPAASKVFDVGTLVSSEKRVGLKNLHIVDAPTGAGMTTILKFFGMTDKLHAIRLLPVNPAGWQIGLLLPKKFAKPQGWTAKKPSAALLKDLKARFGDGLGGFDATTVYWLGADGKAGSLDKVSVPAAGLQLLLTVAPPSKGKATATLNIVQETDGRVVGGNTFVLRRA